MFVYLPQILLCGVCYLGGTGQFAANLSLSPGDTSVSSYEIRNGYKSLTRRLAPVLNYTKIPLQSQNIQAKLFPNESDPMAIFAAPPSPAVDKAWHRVSSNMIFGLTQSDVLRLGKDPKTAVKYNPEWNIHSPEDLYLGVLDTFHQVHCLNMLRQNLIINYHYYWGKTFGFRPEAFRERHLSHCTSILLQNIMCHSDLEVVTHVWREGNPVPWPDFGVKKQCRDFDELIKFRDSMDLDDSWEKFRLYTKRPSDAVVLPMEDGLTELMASADEFRDGEYYKDLHIEGCST
ncbi:hypothetical protein V2A60_010464 [Cordyceps javanica]|uniref:Tat pathway signal sequence protein n=1 Tax=Cordyceps javanica TaxID=43265 RepID=A0A545VIM0_9HYPO|nr:tat pathway signal sequence protein [Cordyceps javanica]TQW01579.1 hypothetical protein IF2G_10903 [Cordyceps javanica]